MKYKTGLQVLEFVKIVTNPLISYTNCAKQKYLAAFTFTINLTQRDKLNSKSEDLLIINTSVGEKT